MFISGKSDWGVYQSPGALERMQTSACTDMRGVHLLDGAGHWVQQEQPEQVNGLSPGVPATVGARAGFRLSPAEKSHSIGLETQVRSGLE